MFFGLVKEREIPKPVELTSEEYRRLVVRITAIEGDILALATTQNLIHDKIVKKLNPKKRLEDEDNDTWGGIPAT